SGRNKRSSQTDSNKEPAANRALQCERNREPDSNFGSKRNAVLETSSVGTVEASHAGPLFGSPAIRLRWVALGGCRVSPCARWRRKTGIGCLQSNRESSG